MAHVDQWDSEWAGSEFRVDVAFHAARKRRLKAELQKREITPLADERIFS
jgi:hypothetical protein